MGVKAILNNKEIPDSDFEREMMKELDSSRVQEQYYLGVYTLTSDTVSDLEPGEESVRSPYKKSRTADEMFEGDYISQEEKNSLAEQNMKLIDKCIGQFMPKSNSDKKLYCIEDIKEACFMGFCRALDEYPRSGSAAKFSTYAYELMSNACRDVIKGARAKKRGFLLTDSLDAPIASGSSKEEDEATIGDLVGTNMDGEETEKQLNTLTMQSLILSVFQGMDKESVLILTYKFGIGSAEYEHTEAEIADIMGLPPAQIKRKLAEAMEGFKFALYQEGLLSEAETILVEDMGYSKRQIKDSMADANKKYLDSLMDEFEDELGDMSISISGSDDEDYDEGFETVSDGTLIGEWNGDGEDVDDDLEGNMVLSVKNIPDESMDDEDYPDDDLDDEPPSITITPPEDDDEDSDGL